MKHLEIKTVEYKGIKVVVKIDYDLKEVSLVENAGKNQGNNQYVPKQWVFSKRGIEYMVSWMDILQAMQNAIVSAKKDLQEYIDAETKKKEDLMMAIHKEDLKKNK